MLPNSTAPPRGALQLIKKNYRFRPNGMLYPLLVFHSLGQQVNRYDLLPATIHVNPALALGDVVNVVMSPYPTAFTDIEVIT